MILGHVALTKIKCIPIVIHYAIYPDRDTLSNAPCSGYLTARDRGMVESGFTEGGKNTASFSFRG